MDKSANSNIVYSKSDTPKQVFRASSCPDGHTYTLSSFVEAVCVCVCAGKRGYTHRVFRTGGS